MSVEKSEMPRGKIILAEDDDAMRRFLEVTLTREGFEVLTARDGLEALEIALHNDFDALVTDAVMPNMTGFDLCRMLRQNPEKKHLPIILLTGFGKETELLEKDCQADVYLTKEKSLREDLTETLADLLT